MFNKKEWMDKYRQTDGYKIYQREYRKKHRIKINAQNLELQRKNKLKNPEYFWNKYRRNNLKRRYGITPEYFNLLLEKQNGVCAICGSKNSVPNKYKGSPQRLSVDHCHKTGKVRGLLCFSCNRALGYFKDDIKLLERAIKYLSLAKESNPE